MKNLMYVTAAILLAAGLGAVPAFAQGTMTKPPMKSHRTMSAVPGADPAAAKTMPMKAHHTKSCYDHAWDSQAQKDCLAGKAAMPMGKKSMKKAAAPKMT
jgi:hypothetical protein